MFLSIVTPHVELTRFGGHFKVSDNAPRGAKWQSKQSIHNRQKNRLQRFHRNVMASRWWVRFVAAISSGVMSKVAMCRWHRS